MDSPKGYNTTRDDTNICSQCGGLDNTSHICNSDRFLDPLPPQQYSESYLKKSQRELDEILRQLREARQESYMFVSQVSEAERMLQRNKRGQELVEIRHSQLAMRALSESLKIIDLMKAMPSGNSADSGYSFNIPDIVDR